MPASVVLDLSSERLFTPEGKQRALAELRRRSEIVQRAMELLQRLKRLSSKVQSKTSEIGIKLALEVLLDEEQLEALVEELEEELELAREAVRCWPLLERQTLQNICTDLGQIHQCSLERQLEINYS